MTASDPADEATGIVGDGSAPSAAPNGPDDSPMLPEHASARVPVTHSADALFAGDAPPAATATPATRVSTSGLEALFATTRPATTPSAPAADSATTAAPTTVAAPTAAPAIGGTATSGTTGTTTSGTTAVPATAGGVVTAASGTSTAASAPATSGTTTATTAPAATSATATATAPTAAPATAAPTAAPAAATPPLTKPPFEPRSRARRATEEPDAAAELLAAASEAQWADDSTPATALTWVDPASVAAHAPTASLDAEPEPESAAALMRGARLRPAIARPGLLVPLGVLAGLVATYSGTTLLWPLHEVPPTVQAVEFDTVPATAAELTWPAQGAAAVGIGGVSTTASMPDAVSIASITKVVSSLMVLDRMPLALGEQGPEFTFTRSDSARYWEYRRSDQSALDVPVGGVLTEYQLLQGTLLGSANNYIDRLSQEIWGSNAAFAEAAEVWLRDRGLTGITVVTPSGFDERNVATPEALVALGELAMRNPVFAEIVGTASVDLPGAGTVVNTNGMLADPGVVGIKTGTLVGWNLLTAKDVTVGDSTVRLFAAVLNQDDDEARLAATRALFGQTEAELQTQKPAVPEGTVVGRVTTAWGEDVEVVTGEDAEVVLWNGTAASASAVFDLGEKRESDDTVGTLTTTGPLDTDETPLVLREDVDGPSPWWRLTHPFELLGITVDPA
ncbi:D-alanyl-D-alanine carboxypeptidase family protein [Microbacterium sp. p3-SID336]|uniref:D-alanyl-D-alanine carboxypeptidase family protein n=1 Tax=Microbacterium sp. p3-SID336 TaxID=2916212 RepID=UPI0021A2B18A|nr:D-alanyl-D-alanine carboxypeptidase [Microbacterium sp. p3-SID336]MCT1480065.1 D-alanyl-D-alanine carboxypeptidase [Microbacterium sp. p3-SID336]